jgi:hypothetical protein
MQQPSEDCVYGFEERAYSSAAEMEEEVAVCVATIVKLREGLDCEEVPSSRNNTCNAEIVSCIEVLHRSFCTLRRQIDYQRRFLVREMSYHHSIAVNVLSADELETVHSRSQFTN